LALVSIKINAIILDQLAKSSLPHFLQKAAKRAHKKPSAFSVLLRKKILITHKINGEPYHGD